MRLEREVDMTNWDAAFAKMEKDEIHPEDIPTVASEPDPEIEEFQVHHEALHHAVHAVVEASNGEIKILPIARREFLFLLTSDEEVFLCKLPLK